MSPLIHISALLLVVCLCILGQADADPTKGVAQSRSSSTSLKVYVQFPATSSPAPQSTRLWTLSVISLTTGSPQCFTSHVYFFNATLDCSMDGSSATQVLVTDVLTPAVVLYNYTLAGTSSDGTIYDNALYVPIAMTPVIARVLGNAAVSAASTTNGALIPAHDVLVSLNSAADTSQAAWTSGYSNRDGTTTVYYPSVLQTLNQAWVLTTTPASLSKSFYCDGTPLVCTIRLSAPLLCDWRMWDVNGSVTAFPTYQDSFPAYASTSILLPGDVCGWQLPRANWMMDGISLLINYPVLPAGTKIQIYSDTWLDVILRPTDDTSSFWGRFSASYTTTILFNSTASTPAYTSFTMQWGTTWTVANWYWIPGLAFCFLLIVLMVMTCYCLHRRRLRTMALELQRSRMQALEVQLFQGGSQPTMPIPPGMRDPQLVPGTSRRTVVLSPDLLKQLPVHVYDGAHSTAMVTPTTTSSKVNRLLQGMSLSRGASSKRMTDVESGAQGSTDARMLGYKTCPICLEDLVAGDVIRHLPCQHWFHVKCVDAWLSTRQAVCPLCKDDVLAALIASGALPNGPNGGRQSASRSTASAAAAAQPLPSAGATVVILPPALGQEQAAGTTAAAAAAAVSTATNGAHNDPLGVLTLGSGPESFPPEAGTGASGSNNVSAGVAPAVFEMQSPAQAVSPPEAAGVGGPVQMAVQMPDASSSMLRSGALALAQQLAAQQDELQMQDPRRQ